MSTVYVGLSGGVDSATSAALLQRAGYAVTGVFIKIWQPEFIECTWREDRLDAMRVAAALRIPFREIDLSQEYKDAVIADMIKNYQEGKTPNPDVLCNRHIKFGHFAQWALSEGADLVATGHYAQVEKRGERFHLLRGVDLEKDQSYFLCELHERDLKHTLFPIGGYTKARVRALAQEFDLPVARKKDSQGLCFVGDISIPEFLSRYIPLSHGRLLNEQGVVVGEHDGAALYTRGQRHGFRVAPAFTHMTPFYVIATDVENNTVTVSPERTRASSRVAVVETIHTIRDDIALPSRLLAQTRYREEAHAVVVSQAQEKDVVTFETPVVMSPGQSLVLYDGPELLGSSIIRAVKNS